MDASFAVHLWSMVSLLLLQQQQENAVGRNDDCLKNVGRQLKTAQG
jgi:hypothetical protein